MANRRSAAGKSHGTTLGMRGVTLGLLAGLVFAIAQVAAAILRGDGILDALRYPASVVLGEQALVTTPLWAVIIVGLIAHFVIAALFGALYGAILSNLRTMTRAQMGVEALLGFGFGTAIWLLNYQLLARSLYPWFLDLSQVAQWLLHAVFFGLPLALLFAAAERREPAEEVVGPPEQPSRLRPKPA